MNVEVEFNNSSGYSDAVIGEFRTPYHRNFRKTIIYYCKTFGKLRPIVVRNDRKLLVTNIRLLIYVDAVK